MLDSVPKTFALTKAPPTRWMIPAIIRTSFTGAMSFPVS